jgi:hypothetical protein
VIDAASSGIDGYCLGFGGWLSEDSADPEDFILAATILQAEEEWREGGWEAVQRVLRHVEDGELVLPDDAGDQAELFQAMWRLGWIGAAPTGDGEADA